MTHEQELEIRQQFLDEAGECLATLNVSLQEGLAQSHPDSEQINAALRVAHSLKGGAAMLGFQLLSQLAHQLEDSLKVLKVVPTMALDDELRELLLSAAACLHHVTEADRQGITLTSDWLVAHVDPIFNQLRSRLGDPQPETAASVLALDEDVQSLVPLLFETEVEDYLRRLEAMLTQPETAARLREEVLSMAQDLGGLGEMLGLPRFTHLCESVQQALNAPATPAQIQEMVQAARQTWRYAQSVILRGQLELVPDHLPVFPEANPALLLSQPLREDPAATPAPALAQLPALPVPTPEETHEATVRVSVKLLNQLNDLFGELTLDRNGLDLYLRRLRTLVRMLHQRVQHLEQVNSKLRTTYDFTLSAALPQQTVALPLLHSLQDTSPDISNMSTSARAQFDVLELDRYTDLHLLSQQVIETIVQLQEVSEDLGLSLDDTEQTVRNLNRTAKRMQTRLTQLRMRPLAEILDRFPRALQDWCQQYQKQVRLVVSGGDLLLDRNILEALQDSLMHLLRNAFDHGIEAPQTRLAAGKPREGVIAIQATSAGNRTIITVQDDGAGIPTEQIRARAAQIGLDPALLAAATDMEVLSLIFEPGFSTRDQVTPLSGRGIGMDVVRTYLKQVRGEITVDTIVGTGTVFTLSLPSTLSTVRVVLVESHGMLLALPTDAVIEVSLFTPESVLQTVGGEVLNYQGRMIPLLHLDRWLVFNGPRSAHDFEPPPMIKSASVLTVQQGSQWLGLRVDRCWNDQEATLRRVESMLPLPIGFSSCTILGDGRVVPLVNLPELLHWMTTQDLASRSSAQSQVAGLPSPPPPAPPLEQPIVLVIDDSINVRRFLALTLERAGYQVEQAKDGQDGLEQLQQGLQPRLVICDVEMPRLDGYGFLDKVKANPALSHLPIAMLTSRSGGKHRQLAMQLGAAAYFSKPYNEQVLLRTVEQLCQSQT